MPFTKETAKQARSKATARTENKVNRLVKDVVSEVFNFLQSDEEAKTKKADLKSWATEHPKEFYQIAAKLIPVQMQHAGEVVARILIEDAANCEPLKKPDEGNTGIQSQSEGV